MVQKDTCTPVFITLLFTIAKTRKQSKRPSTAEDKDVACVCVSHSVVFNSLQPHGQSPLSVHLEFSRQEYQSGLLFPFLGDLINLGIKCRSPALQADSSPSEPTREAPKMWYPYTMEYHSTIKKNEIMPSAAAWMDLEIFIQSELSQIEKDKYHISLTHGVLKKDTNNAF